MTNPVFSSTMAYLEYRDMPKRASDPVHEGDWENSELGWHLTNELDRRGLSARDVWILDNGAPGTFDLSGGFGMISMPVRPDAADLARLSTFLDMVAADVGAYRMLRRAGWVDDKTDQPAWGVVITETLERLVAPSGFTPLDLWQWDVSGPDFTRKDFLNGEERSADGPDSVIPVAAQLTRKGSTMRLYYSDDVFSFSEMRETELLVRGAPVFKVAKDSIVGRRLEEVIDCSSAVPGLVADRIITQADIGDICTTFVLDVPVRTLAPIPHEHLVELGLEVDPADAARPWWLLTPPEKLRGWKSLALVHSAAA
ncbi:hypothetical protein [Novosphingobium sp.]|uniref:hypothetical protein n=1 Tax=Novosphingobium sp. TaxID=1874826 RepID=UPI0028AF62D6|nr:hypothetical protein [Novosphingobium sp.]